MMQASFDRNQNNGHAWQIEHLGGASVYPGHPVVMAAMIMDRYASFDAANEKNPQFGWPHPLGDSFIPGAGDAVYAGLDVLKYARLAGLPAAYKHAVHYWNGWREQSPEHNASGYAQGLAQFDKIRAHFEARLKVWGTPEDAGSPHRVAA